MRTTPKELPVRRQPRLRRQPRRSVLADRACDLHGVDPVEYLRDVLIRVDTRPAADIDALLPHRWTPPTRVTTVVDGAA